MTRRARMSYGLPDLRAVFMSGLAALLAGQASAADLQPQERTIHSQASWILANGDVEVAVTKLGGQMAPVTFDRKSKAPIQPYHISPWQDEGLKDLPAAVLSPLRGDFFCMPFGGNAVGHHATLAMPEEEGSIAVSVSPFRLGMTCPGVFSDPANREYQSLASGENRGRHGVPWNGRNNCLGLGDVCAYFAEGLVPSTMPNLLSKQGIRTAVELDAKRPTEIRYAQGAVRVPADFDRVTSIDFSTPEQITLAAESGATVTVPVRHEFVLSKAMRD